MSTVRKSMNCPQSTSTTFWVAVLNVEVHFHRVQRSSKARLFDIMPQPVVISARYKAYHICRYPDQTCWIWHLLGPDVVQLRCLQYDIFNSDVKPGTHRFDSLHACVVCQAPHYFQPAFTFTASPVNTAA
jgi:hypothetical protein